MLRRLTQLAATAVVIGLFGGSPQAGTLNFGCDTAAQCGNPFAAFDLDKKSFVYEVREGVAGAGDFETKILTAPDTNNALGPQGQVAWGANSSNGHSFTFSYIEGVAKLGLSGVTSTLLSVADDLVGANTLVLRAKAEAQGGDGTVAAFLDSFTLTDKDGVSLADLASVSLAGDANATYLVITGLNLLNGFILTGDAMFNPGALLNGRSRVAYQLKVGVSPVPVPAALPLFLGALAGLGLLVRRRHRNG